MEVESSISETWDVHIARLRGLQSLDEAGLTINLAKSQFDQATITYLGHIVGQGQCRPKTANVDAILNFAVPTTRKSLMRFLGMTGYYRRYCKNFISVAAPLTWDQACQEAFNQLKKAQAILFSSLQTSISPLLFIWTPQAFQTIIHSSSSKSTATTHDQTTSYQQATSKNKKQETASDWWKNMASFWEHHL
ncbi:uncharacterized mitochondrial protein AtMg00860-like [Homarus americanus]|uniref:uncharacterized mitochondrial protein AtMg00860-like n=1 Tax=Homarus americanus TaxID=6706 RepID=UPI001C45D929|nr:uncharacterized mitochondrial protein AtMg00860-like [Homarus americanus]